MKFLVPNYSCLQNPPTRGLPPPDPCSLCPQLNLLKPPTPPRTKFLGTPLDTVESGRWAHGITTQQTAAPTAKLVPTTCIVTVRK